MAAVEDHSGGPEIDSKRNHLSGLQENLFLKTLAVACAEDPIEEKSLVAVRIDIDQLGGEVGVRSVRVDVEINGNPPRDLQGILERLGHKAQVILALAHFPLIHGTFSAQD